MKPPWAEKQWFEVHYIFGSNPSTRRLDRRRRTRRTCEKIVEEMRATGNYAEVWIVEVNRLTRDRIGVAGNPRTARRG